MPVDALLSRLQGVRKRGRDSAWMALCPAHEDRTTSLAISEQQDGRILIHCHAACSPQDVLGAIGLEFDALYPERPLDPRKPAKPMRKPWRATDLVHALEYELLLALVVLNDVAKGTPITDEVRTRAGEAHRRIARFLQELEHAA